MSTTSTPKDGQSTLDIWLVPPENAVETEYWVYMHFAEVKQLQPKESRQMYITWNGQLLVSQFSPSYLATNTLNISKTVGQGRYDLSIVKAATSTLPPILNAIEIYTVKEFLQSETNQEDINAITDIKSTYKIKKNWQGDPCSPEVYLWEGLKCSYNENEPPRIISLDLSSSVLTGEIAPSISKLAMVQTLDLSNNNLTGSIPGSLSQLQNLNVLKLEKNKLTGSVPEGLNDRWKNGSLSLSLCENPNLSGQVSCKKKKKNIVLLVILPILGTSIFILVATVIWWGFFKSKVPPKAQEGRFTGVSSISTQRRIFTKSEIRQITSNFSRKIGQGGFGEVYQGTLPDGKQVAVKRLLPSAPIESLETFKTEAMILMNVSHRNVVPLIGYCDEVGAVALVYQYLPKGNLQQQLSAAPHPTPVVSSAASPHDRLLNNNARSSQQLNGQSVTSQLELTPSTAYHTAQDGILKWKERLIIGIDIARGLGYLHTHYDSPIVHRDIKSANILLTEKLRAKIGDFGIAKVFASESSTHATTRSIGKFGYLDPEYQQTKRLTTKSDVYSFGIVLLELITGRQPIMTEEQTAGTQVRINISDWVRREDRSGDIANIVDPNLEGRYKNSSVQKAKDIALKCALIDSNGRPEIADVYKDLKECLRLEDSEERTVENDGPTSPGWWRYFFN